MQYDLELLEDLITVTLDPKKTLLIPPSIEKIAEYERLAITEKIRIQKRMKSITGKPVEEKYKEKYIQRNQQDIIALENIIVDYLLPLNAQGLELNKNDTPLSGLYKILFHTLNDLLNFIEELFQPYFNLEEKVPKSHLLRSLDAFKAKAKIIHKKFLKSDGILIALMIKPIKQLWEKEDQVITYRHFLYIKKLLADLEKLSTNRLPYTSFTALEEQLLYFNFNCGEFSSFLIANLVDVINALPDQQKKTEWLLKTKKEINQLLTKPGVALKPNCIHVKEQVSAWITEEIHYLETKQRLFSVAPVIKDEILADEEKLHFSVSVNVLALFVRAAQDSALLLNEKGTIVFKNVAKYCRTVQAKKPGAESMDKKSHVAERAHKEKAIVALQEMIKWVHGY